MIETQEKSRSPNVIEILREYRDVLLNLTLRDFKLRYRSSVLGFFWSLLNPLMMMVIFSIVFSFLFKSSITDYPVFVLPAILIWRFFSVSTMYSLDTITGNYQLVTKIYFPRWLLVLSSGLANLLGSSLEFIACFPILLVAGMRLDVSLVFVPLVIGVVFVLNLGLSLALASLNLFYRDFKQIWEIALQAGFYLSPVFYSQSIIPASISFEYSLNPMARAIESLRDAMYYGVFPSATDLLFVLLAGAVTLFIGFLFFGRVEKHFGDVI